MFSGFLQCCNSNHEAVGVAELRVVHLSSDVNMQQPVHLLTSPDSFDLTSTPRGALKAEAPRRPDAVTPRQRTLRERIWLPKLRRYPVPPGCSPDDPEEVRREELLTCYQDFVMELLKGVHMTQLTSNQEYSDIHCQVLEDLQTLKVDQGSGCIIEFPLGAVSKVYRIVKNEDRWYGNSSPAPPLPVNNSEHIVVVEFMRRKLAFVFHDIKIAQRFLMCTELLIRRAQECQGDSDAFGSRTRARGAGGGVAPMFTSFGTKAPAERHGKPLLPLDVLRKDGAGGAPSTGKGSGGGRRSPICACDAPI